MSTPPRRTGIHQLQPLPSSNQSSPHDLKIQQTSANTTPNAGRKSTASSLSEPVTWAKLAAPKRSPATSQHTTPVDPPVEQSVDETVVKAKRVRHKRAVSPETLERRRLEQLRIERKRALKPKQQLTQFSSLIDFHALEPHQNYSGSKASNPDSGVDSRRTSSARVEPQTPSSKSSQASTPSRMPVWSSQHTPQSAGGSRTTSNVSTPNGASLYSTPSPHKSSKRIIGITGIDPSKAHYLPPESINTIIASNTHNRNTLDHNVAYVKMSKTKHRAGSAKPTKLRAAMTEQHMEQYIREFVLRPLVDAICYDEHTADQYKLRKQLKQEKRKQKFIAAKAKAYSEAEQQASVYQLPSAVKVEAFQSIGVPKLPISLRADLLDLHRHNMALLHFGVQPHIGLVPHIQSTEQQHHRVNTLYTTYCQQLFNSAVDNLCVTLLSKLYEFYQKVYQYEPEKAALKRRYVSGLNEVYKRCKLKDCKAVIVATNIEYDGSVKDGVSEVLERALRVCVDSDIPIIFGCKRRELAGALHVTRSKFSAVGLIDVNGAYDVFRQLLETRDRYREQYGMIKQDTWLHLT